MRPSAFCKIVGQFTKRSTNADCIRRMKFSPFLELCTSSPSAPAQHILILWHVLWGHHDKPRSSLGDSSSRPDLASSDRRLRATSKRIQILILPPLRYFPQKCLDDGKLYILVLSIASPAQHLFYSLGMNSSFSHRDLAACKTKSKAPCHLQTSSPDPDSPTASLNAWTTSGVKCFSRDSF